MPPVTPLRLKIEINTREHFHCCPLEETRFSVQSRWFGGTCGLRTAPVFLENLAAKLQDPGFLSDTPPLLRPGVAYDPHEAHAWIAHHLSPHLPEP